MYIKQIPIDTLTGMT